MLNIGDKIYYMDYEESGASYTIEGIFEVKNNPVMKDGLYYSVHSDKLPIETGRYTIAASNIDLENSRFFSSAEKASAAYKRHISNSGIAYSDNNEEKIEK